MAYRPDIDGLRAVAVLPVVFYHAGFPGPSGGFVGVDVFFVISGFLITSIVAREIAEGRFSLLSFYERRARRILPALTVVCLASIAAGWVVLLPGEMQDLGQSAVATALFASNVHFLLTIDYFSRAAEFVPLLHTWSLAVEEQFYLVFPPLLMLLAARGGRSALWTVAALSVLSFAAAVIVLPQKPDWAFYLIFFRAWELGAGALLALAMLRPPRWRAVREALALIGICAILGPVFLFEATTPFPGMAALPPVLGAALLIWIGAQGGGSMVNTLLAHRLPVWIGLISYSLYLWHWPILAFLRITLDTAVLPLTLAGAAVAASVALAWLSFRLVERPFRLRGSRGFGGRAVFAASAAALAILAGTGLALHAFQGVPARLPVAAADMAAFADDRHGQKAECFERRPKAGLCPIGTTPDEAAHVDFLFWGDSHANASLPGMDGAAKLVGRNGLFAGYPGCPPILDIQRRSSRAQACTRFNESMFSWLEQRPDVPLVILGARWTLSVEGTRYRGEAGEAVSLEWTGASAPPPEVSGNAALVEAGLAATVARIVATGRHVVLLGPVPEVGRNVPASYARQAMLGWTPVAAVTREDHEARAGRTERILKRVAETSDKVRYVPLSDLFCDGPQCRVKTDDGRLLYFDDDHISQTAALDLLPARLQAIWYE